MICMKQETSKVDFMNFIGGKDVMPITGYYGPHPQFESSHGANFPNLYTDEIFEMIAESGVKVIVYSHTDYKESPELVEKSLDLAQKHGIGMFVLDSTILDKAGEPEMDKNELAKQIENYCKHPAFCGMFVVDEPRTPYHLPGDGTKYISRYEQLANILQYDLGYTCYLNMFPVWNLPVYQESYERYVAEFCETLRPKYIMWDNYPFAATDGLDVYFYNMNLMREYAKKYKVPFWAYIEAGAQWNDEKEHFDSKLPYYPNEAQFDWNVNTCLAFGAQGIQYFPLIQPEHFAYAKSTEWDSERNGIIGVFGNKTQWHGYAKRMNEHIRAIDEVLMNSVHKGIIVTSEQAQKDMELAKNCLIESGEFWELMSVCGDAMVGCFDYHGKTALYVVNYSMKHEQNIELHFDKTYDVQMVKQAEVSVVNESTLQLDMSAGEGVLLVIR